MLSINWEKHHENPYFFRVNMKMNILSFSGQKKTSYQEFR